MELLVAITIIAVLLSLLMPLAGKVRSQALVLRCMSNLRQLGAITLLRAQDRRYIWQSCIDYNGTGIMAERMQRFRNDDPAARFGAWRSAQTEQQLNLPELLDYVDGGMAQFKRNNLLQCPASAFIANIDQPSDVNDYWYKQFGTPYVYTGWVSKWYDQSLGIVPTNDVSRFCDRTGGGDKLLWSDLIFRWTGGTSNGHPRAPWSINHSPLTWQTACYGPPPIISSNQCFGDGHVVTRHRTDFAPAAMDALSDDPSQVLYIRSAGGFNDRRFF